MAEVVNISGELPEACRVDFLDCSWSSFVVTVDKVGCMNVVGESTDAVLDIIDSVE